MDDELRKSLRKVQGKVLRKFDQQLEEVHDLYRGLPIEERQKFRRWLLKLVDVAEPEVRSLPVYVHVQLENTFQDQAGEVGCHGIASLSPKVMLTAVDAWDRGEEFAPKGMFETL